MVEINGKTFNSINAACKHFKIDSSYLSKKSKLTGIPKDVLLTEKLQGDILRYPFVYKDKKYVNLSAVCQQYDLDKVKVQSLMDNRGISRSEALDLSIKHKGDVPRNRIGMAVTINGKEFVSKSAAIRYYGVSNAKFYDLQRDGLEPEQAINILKKNKQ